MKNIKITIEYDGSAYSGWQIQPKKNTIQKQIQDAIHSLTQQNIKILGSGRTDQGVHAHGQVANFHSHESLTLTQWQNGLNHFLPNDIQIIKTEFTPDKFHSQMSAKSKIYRYYLSLDKQISVFKKKYIAPYPFPIDMDLLSSAVNIFIGKHDFESFSANRGKDEPKNKIRNLMKFDIHDEKKIIYFELEADGFLYKMVRMLVGSVLMVARGKTDINHLKELIKSPNGKSGPAVNPCGLTLWEVKY